MCGIVGYVGREEAAPILLDGLERLEYRGYDSAGVAVVTPERGIESRKAKGRLSVLREQLHGGADLRGTVGMGHTRGATHGAPNDVNSHPQVSQSGRVAVVHNGIIENDLELRAFLTGEGAQFHSETDTEVVAHLLEYCYRRCGDLMEAVEQTLRRLKGAYALGILCSRCPDRILAVRKDAPLLLGVGENGSFLASDATALLPYTRDVIYMDNGEVAVLTAGAIEIYNDMGQTVQKPVHHIQWEVDAAEKGGYPHFMLKEIMEQGEALTRTIAPRIRSGRVVLESLKLSHKAVRRLERICIVACGSAYHVGMVGKYVLEELLRVPVEASLASEFRYSRPVIGPNTLVIVISQSGETFDSLAALREAKAQGAHVLSIVNVVGSSIARESDDVLYTWAGPEIAVATTKGFSTQLAALDLLGLYLGEIRGSVAPERYAQVVEGLIRLPGDVAQVLDGHDHIRSLAAEYFNHSCAFFMGRNMDYAIGLEGSLKLKEISYIHSEAYAAGELKHGTIALIEPGTLVVALCSCGRLFEKAMNNVREVQARGADLLGLTTESLGEEMARTADHLITIPDTVDLLLPSLMIVPLQLFSYYVALERGCDIDKPRNLAKSVTVE